MRGDLWKKEVAGSRQQKLQHHVRPLVTNLGWGWPYRTIALYLALVTIRPGLHTYHVTRKKLRHLPTYSLFMSASGKLKPEAAYLVRNLLSF